MADSPDRLSAALSGRYRIERELGQGGMATVYVAEDLKHHRKVAVKVLKPDLAATLGAERFLREIEIAAGLTHPHILTLIDSGEADGFLYYVMPFVEGESLRARLIRQGELPIADAVRILRDVTDALALAHSHGVVHRDIKPDNVLLMGNHAVVTDFGVAKAVSEATGRQKMTTAGVALGTPAYMAPEQAAADPNVDARADIYAVGAMAYEMLTGRPPFTGLTPQEVLAAHVTQAPDPVIRHRETLSPALAELVMRCLAKKPADRWQMAADLVHQLEVLATPSGGMQPTSAVAVSPVPGRWPTARIALIAAAAVVLVGGGWIAVRTLRGRSGASARPKMVVLPFESSGPQEDAYFADGVSEEIATKLGSLSGMAVLAYTSALHQYAAKPIPEIGRGLGVQYVLLGSVRSSGADKAGRVRVTPRLVRVSDETQIWAESYEEQTADVFQIQANIAERVAQALNVSFGAREREVLAQRPTSNLQAYQYFLRGNDYRRRELNEADARMAVEMYQRAVQTDPEFADAYAALGRARIWLSWEWGDSNDRALGKEAIDRAMELAPQRAESQFALGEYYYRGIQDYEAALKQFQAALQIQPSLASAQASVGFILRRQGHLDAAIGEMTKALELDPLDYAVAFDVGESYAAKGDWDAANRFMDQAIAMAADQPSAHSFKIYVALHHDADTRGARRLLKAAAADLDTTTALYWERVDLIYLEHQYDGVVRALSRDRAPLGYYFLVHAFADRFAGRRDQSVRYADSARTEFDRQLVAGGTSLRPGARSKWLLSVGLAYALMDRRDDAIREGRRALELYSPSRDAYSGGRLLEGLAQILVLVGEPAQALDYLEQFAMGQRYPNQYLPLRLNPVWDPIRNDPRFQRLLQRMN